LPGRARVHGFDNPCQRRWRPTSKGSPQAAPTLFLCLKSGAAIAGCRAPKKPSSERRTNVFEDLILIKKQRDFFGIVTSGLIWWRT
jgi:hypothetical protein